MALSHVLLIDESQTSVPQTGVNPQRLSRFCVTVGVACLWEKCGPLLHALDDLREGVFVPQKTPREWKGRYLVAGGNRRASITIDRACSQLAALATAHGLNIWVMVADRTTFADAEVSQVVAARDAARQFLFERVTGNPAFRAASEGSWAVVADHETSREVARLTTFMKGFYNEFTRARLPSWIHSAALAGASEDWGGIQVADVYAYFAAHYRASEMKVGGDFEVATAFKTRLWPTLMHTVLGRTRGIGYKTW